MCRYFSRFTLYLLALFVCSCGLSAKENSKIRQHAPASTEAALRQQIAALGNLLEGVDGAFDLYSVSIYFTCGKNKAPDCRALALFTIDPIMGNTGVQYVAIFDPVDGNEILPELQKGVQSNIYLHTWQLLSFLPLLNAGYTLKNIKYSNNEVTLSGLTWGPHDAHCCPSRKTTISFKIKNGVLMPKNTQFLKEGF